MSVCTPSPVCSSLPGREPGRRVVSRWGWSGAAVFDDHEPIRSAAVFDDGSQPADGRSAPSSSNRHSAPVGAVTASAGRRGWRDLDARLLAVMGRLTERDRQLCRLLDDHRVLTTAQVADVGFTGERRARMRLSELYALDVLDRFRPQAW